LSLRYGLKSFAGIEEGPSKSWPSPGEKSVDVEMGVLRNKIHMGKNESTTTLNASPEEVMEVADRIEHYRFALRSPEPTHSPDSSYSRSFKEKWEVK
jgi:hypothetical protein